MWRSTDLLKRQHRKCAYCRFYFQAEDLLELDPIIPKALGGKDESQNWQLLHRHCHDLKTAGDSYHPNHRCGTDDSSQIVEKLDKPFGLRRVLQTSGIGRPAR
jgi:RNA-directed DNA polymerase